MDTICDKIVLIQAKWSTNNTNHVIPTSTHRATQEDGQIQEAAFYKRRFIQFTNPSVCLESMVQSYLVLKYSYEIIYEYKQIMLR